MSLFTMLDTPTGNTRHPLSKSALLKRVTNLPKLPDDIFGQPEAAPSPYPTHLPMETILSGKLLLMPAARHKITKDNLSEFLDDTGITLQIGDDDFIGLDDMAEEFGGNISEMMSLKFEKKQQAIKEAALAEEERVSRKRRPGMLKTKPSNLTAKNLRYNDELMDKGGQVQNYIDMDEIDDGFDEDFDLQMATRAKPRQYRLNAAIKPQLVGYNFNEGVKNRLTRIPLFYRQTNDLGLSRQMSKMLLNANQPTHPSKLKNEFLARYRDDAKPRRKPAPKMQTFRELPANVLVTSSMKFNKDKSVWEGNDGDLARFERPLLIEPHANESQPLADHMVYDPKNGRWINTKPDDEELIFNDIPDLSDERYLWRQPSQYKLVAPPKMGFDRRPLLQLPMKSRDRKRVVSQPSMAHIPLAGEDYQMSDDLIRRFHREQAKIEKKVNNWFNVGEAYDFREVNEGAAAFSRDYLWEIHKLVLDTYPGK